MIMIYAVEVENSTAQNPDHSLVTSSTVIWDKVTCVLHKVQTVPTSIYEKGFLYLDHFV